MDQAGHSCHHPTRQWESIIYLRGEHCAPCLAHKPVPGPKSPPSWTPSYALVALRCIWDSTQENRDAVNASPDFSQWLSDQTIYGFKEANEFFDSLPQDTDEDWYLSWVNESPSDLRYTVTQYSLEEWQAMDDCLTGSEHGGSLNIRSCLLQWWQLLPPPTPAPEFHDAIRESGHTCWEEPQMDDYAAAMAFLGEDPKVVGIDVKEDSGCHVFRLPWRLRSLGENLPVEEWEFEADLTEVLVMLRIECSKRKVAWSVISTSAEMEFINTGFSDFSEEAESSDAGTDEDEACGEDERAPVAVIHPSQVNTAGHGENNPSSGLVQNEKVLDVDEESADAVRRPNFTNLLSESPHPYSTGPVNFGEAIIHGRQMHDSQQINALSTNSGGSQGLYAGSDGSFRHMSDPHLHPPSLVLPQHIQNGTPFPWHPMVGQQWEYIDDPTTAANFHEGSSQSLHIDTGHSKTNSRAVEHNDTNMTHRPISPSNQRESLWQNGGDYATTEASEATYANGNPIRRQAPSAIDIEQDVGFTSRNTPPINSQYSRSHASSVAAVGLASPSKRQMADEIKKHLTDEMGKSFFWLVRVGISLAQTDKGQVKLPWLDFETMLGENRVRMINWPAGVARPGKDLSKDTSKGIYGVRLDSLTKIYRAIRDSTAPIQLLRDETVLPNGLYTMSGDPETNVSRKRTRDSGDDEHEMSQPERGGKPFYQKRPAPALAAADPTLPLIT
ncbi:hypothetical protein C8J56DRAFT_1084842 [Mycena floridula]|nr:hypothetical protein C8J56DRAFT_1084842 [Mycena floridula]